MGRRRFSCKAEHRTFTAHHLLTRFPSILPLANFRVAVTPVTSPVVSEIRLLSSHRHLEKEFEVIRGVEDHVEYIAVELALVRRHALEVLHSKGDLGPSREKKRG